MDDYLSGKPNGGVYSSYNMNLYAYTSQNPIKYIDPNGLSQAEREASKKLVKVDRRKKYKNADAAANAAMDIMEKKTLDKGSKAKEYISYVYQEGDDFYHTTVEESESDRDDELPGKQVRRHKMIASLGKRKRKGLVHSHGMAKNKGGEKFSDQDKETIFRDGDTEFPDHKDYKQTNIQKVKKMPGEKSVWGGWLLDSTSRRQSYEIDRDKNGKILGGRRKTLRKAPEGRDPRNWSKQDDRSD